MKSKTILTTSSKDNDVHPEKQFNLPLKIGKICIFCMVFITSIELILRLSRATFYKKAGSPEEMLYLAPYKIMPSFKSMQALIYSKYPPNSVNVIEPIPFRDESMKKYLHSFIIKTNSRGYRGSEFQTNGPKDSFHILFLGDSWVLGWGVNEDESYPLLTKKLLKSLYPQKNIEVFNMGIGGRNSRTGVLLFEKEVPELSPNLIIVSYLLNDFIYANARLDGLLPLAGAAIRATFSKLEISILLRWILIHAGFVIPTPYRPTETSDPALTDYRNNLQKMIDKAEALHVPVIFVTTPVPIQLKAMDMFIQTMRNVALENKIPFLDVENIFDHFNDLSMKKDFDSRINWTYEFNPYLKAGDKGRLLHNYYLYSDMGHPNSIGYRLIAEDIVRIIEHNEYLSRK